MAISLADEPDINVGKFQQERVKPTCKLASNRTLTAPQPPHLETANRARASTYVFLSSHAQLHCCVETYVFQIENIVLDELKVPEV